MKKLLLPFFVIFTCCLANAQEVPEKANVIVITLSDSATAINKTSKTLEEKKYTIKKGKKPSLLMTEPKAIKNGRIYLNAEVKGAEVWLSGKIIYTGQDNAIIEHKGKEGSVSMNAWEELSKVSKAFGGKIRYEIK